MLAICLGLNVLMPTDKVVICQYQMSLLQMDIN